MPSRCHIRSRFPLPSGSPRRYRPRISIEITTTTELGFEPAAKLWASGRCRHHASSTLTFRRGKFATARSGLGSALKSPTATERGIASGEVLRCLEGPSPLPSSTLTDAEEGSPGEVEPRVTIESPMRQRWDLSRRRSSGALEGAITIAQHTLTEPLPFSSPGDIGPRITLSRHRHRVRTRASGEALRRLERAIAMPTSTLTSRPDGHARSGFYWR